MSISNNLLSKDTIMNCISKFDKEEKVKEYALGKIFKDNKYNINLYEVLLKVTVLNSFYSAGLNNNDKSKTIDVVTMAEHIVLEPRFDDWLYSDDPCKQLKAYEYIAIEESKVRNSEYNKCYAFASKYCSWHKPDKFPIMDSRVKEALYKILSDKNDFNSNNWKGENIGSSDYHNYKQFRYICFDFLEYININNICEKELTLKDIDKFLWESEDKNISEIIIGDNIHK